MAAGHAQIAASSTAGVATPAPGIPRPVTSFVGRERELARLRDLLVQPQARLISVVGPGGIGKTRLLLEALREPLDAPPVVYVPLQTVTDVRGAAFAIAKVRSA